MLREKYLNEKFEELKKLISQNKRIESEECFRELRDLDSDLKWINRQANNIWIFDVPLNELSKILYVMDHWGDMWKIHI